MGAGQSADGARASDKSLDQKTVKTSYYELLSIEKHATDDEIKKAYRRKALELHPDRNYGDVERTTALFAEVQAAYEVLSDPQERAWYDSHEDAILHDLDPTAAADSPAGTYEHNVGLTTADDITRMFRRFHGGVEFTDAPSGFFGFLRETFDQLAREEDSAARRADTDAPDYPSFGHKDDSHDDVVKVFYGAWSGFSTRKTFAWRDKYRTSDAEDRRMRRLIEKENRRFRTEGIQEFNDAVRSLVAFVKKRDPRYTPNSQTEEERQKVLRDAAASQAARMRARNEALMNAEVPAWARARGPEDVTDSEMSESESEEEQFECVACRKTFKSERQLDAHEKSKKHVKTVQVLRRKLQKEGQSLGLDVDEQEGSDAVEAEQDTAVPEQAPEQEKEKSHADQQHSPEEANTDDLTTSTQAISIDPDTIESPTLTSSKDNTLPTTASDDDESSSSTSSTHPAIPTPSSTHDSASDSPAPAQRKLGKAAQKRAKKAAAAASSQNSASDDTVKCAACGAGFASRTRLFQHIKDFGHAAPKGQTVRAKGKKG